MTLQRKIKIAHLINPYKCEENNPSYLYYAQPITFKSMNNAKLEAKNKGIEVDLFTVNFPEDDEIIPDYFLRLPYLEKSTKTLFPKISGNKKLPIIQEMLDSIYDNSDADYVVFTNSDIGVQKSFYNDIHDLIINDNLDSFVINRRDDIPKFKNGTRLTEEHLDIIYKEQGKKHPGKDCFVLRRELIKQIQMCNMFTGFPPWGNTLRLILKEIDPNSVIFTDLYLTFHLGSDRQWKSSNNKLWDQNIKEKEKLDYAGLDIKASKKPKRKWHHKLLIKITNWS